MPTLTARSHPGARAGRPGRDGPLVAALAEMPLDDATAHILGRAAAAVDVAVRRTMLARTSGQRRAAALGHAERLERLGRLYERYRELGAFERFFREPREIRVTERMRLLRDDLRVVDLTWPSDYLPFLPEMRGTIESFAENRSAAARLVLHDGARPVAILIHGYLGGVHRTERRVWPMQFLHRIGMDVALFVLPFHGPRARPGPGRRPPFPAADPRVTNEAFRQAMADLRDFVGWLGERHPAAGVMGMSLGGFSAALAATLESRLAFAIPIVPLASIADAARDSGRLGKTPQERQAQHRALDRVYAVTSPLHRAPVLPPGALLVIGAENDRITPVAHAEKLARHFGCRLETMRGGHLLQIGRSDKFRSIGRFFNEIGVI